MKTKDLKNEVLSELELISEMALTDVKNDNKTDFDIDKWLKEVSPNNKKLAEKTDEIITYNLHLFHELNFDIKTENGEYCFLLGNTNTLAYSIKNNWPDGKEPKHREKTRKQNDYNGLNLQDYIMELRHDFNRKEIVYNPEKEYFLPKWKVDEINENSALAKQRVLNTYEKSKPNDLIRLCWKFIRNPAELEGVHYHWINPTVKFEPVGSYEVPEYMQTKTNAA